MVVDVAVESLFPEAAGRKSDSIAGPCRFRERRDHDDVIAAGFAPAMIRDHPVSVGLIERVDVVTPQRRQIAAKPDQVSRETQVIPHGGIRWRVKAVPRQQVWPARIDVPGLILEKFLAHENLGNAGGGQENGGPDPAAASRVPRGGLWRGTPL